MSNEAPRALVVPFTFLMALILTLLPMPEWAVWFRPAWVLLALIYWVITYPYYVSVGSAWILGILLDVLNGTLLGEHALALTVVTYFVLRLHAQLRMYPLLQQALWVGLFVLTYQAILYCVQGMIGGLPKTWMYWAPTLTSMLIWPWVFFILRDFRRRYNTA